LGNQISLKSAVGGTSQDLGDSTEPKHQPLKNVAVRLMFRDSGRYDTEFYNMQYQKASSSCPVTVSTAPLAVRTTSSSLPAGFSWKCQEGRCTGQSGGVFYTVTFAAIQ